MPQLSNEYCAGHFDSCPAIPVAFAAYNVTRYVGKLFHIITGKKKYLISEAKLLSSNLAFPKSKSNIKIIYSGLENNKYKFSCFIEQDNKNISSLELSLISV